MSYVLWIKERAYYSRRVPEIVREFDPREYVRVALRTDSKSEARQKAAIMNQEVESYWQDLVQNHQQHENRRFRKTARIAQQMGFAYKPMSQVIHLPILELLERVLILKDAPQKLAEAALGGKEEPEVTLEQALEMFWNLTKDKIIGKSDFQIRKWTNPRRKAVEDFIALRGNKSFKDVCRDDTVAYRDWWLERVKSGKRDAETANKNLNFFRIFLDMVSGHLDINLNIDHLFKKLRLKERKKKTRFPFTSEQIISILSSPKLENMHPEAKWFLHIMAETGARPSEIVGLTKENILLDEAIPYIDIKEPEGGELKQITVPVRSRLSGMPWKRLDIYQKDFPTTGINPTL